MSASADAEDAPRIAELDAQRGPTPPLPPPGERRRIDLHRRRAVLGSTRIDVRPSRLAIIPPLFGFLLGLGCAALIIWGVTADTVPYWLLAVLLLLALIMVPLSGITLVYAIAGANVIFDQAKQSGAWQQGFLGMGIGTTELVPFWKIEAILVTEAGFKSGGSGGRVEELAQWEVLVQKQSGKRLLVAGMIMPRSFAGAGLAPVMELAAAIAALTAAQLRVEAPPVDLPNAAASPLEMPVAAGVEHGPDGAALRRRRTAGAARWLQQSGPMPHARRRREQH